jgi:hypothetical protein
MREQTVGETILEQLGGARFITMTGARNFIGSATRLTFRIPGAGGRTKNGINFVSITLSAFDTYTVTFSRIRGSIVKIVEQHHNIYADMLQSLFTSVTGLDTHL